MKFAEKLKTLRKERGLTQKEFAKQVKIGRSAISMYELGERLPSYAVLKELAKFFNVSIDFLIGDNPDLAGAPPVSEAPTPAEGADPRINRYYLLSSPAREQLLKYLDFLLASDTPVLSKKAI